MRGIRGPCRAAPTLRSLSGLRTQELAPAVWAGTPPSGETVTQDSTSPQPWSRALGSRSQGSPGCLCALTPASPDHRHICHAFLHPLEQLESVFRCRV